MSMTADLGWRRVSVEGAAATVGFCFASYLLFGELFSDWFGQVLSGPGRISSDAYLVLWILSWESHALVTDPGAFFAGNILHPDPAIIAGSEHMIGYLPLFAPAYWLTGSSIFAYQVTTWLSFALTGAGMYALVRHWGGSRWAAAFAGLVMMMMPGHFKVASALHMTGWFYLPMAVIFFDRLLDNGRVRDAVLLSIFFALQLLCSFYLAYLAVVFLACYGLPAVLVRMLTGKLRWRNLGLLLLAVAASGAVLAVTSVPYLQRALAGDLADHREATLRRTFTSVYMLRAYLSNSGMVLGPRYYLGIVPMGLAVWAILRCRSLGAARVLGLLLALLVSAILAAGPRKVLSGVDLPPLYDLFQMVPGVSSFRAPNRFALTVCFCASAMAGLGLSQLTSRWDRLRSWHLAVVGALVVFTYVDFGLRDFRHQVVEPTTKEEAAPVYARLAALDAGVVLELPESVLRWNIVLGSQYAYYSTFHWHRILNGYTGHIPKRSRELMAMAAALPDPRILRQLVRLTGLRYVVLHTDQLLPPLVAAFRSADGLTLLAEEGADLLFEVVGPIDADLQKELVGAAASDKTFGGLPILPVPVSGRAADIERHSQIRAIPRLRNRLRVRLLHLGDQPWPGYAADNAGVVQWVARWRDATNDLVDTEYTVAPLPIDMLPGDEIATMLYFPGPSAPGLYDLEIGLAQEGEWFPDTLLLPDLDARPRFKKKARSVGPRRLE